MGENRREVQVSVFSDFICPFCYLGSRRLLRLNDEFDLRVNWCGIEIHPETPATGMPVTELGYSDAQWQVLQDNLRRLAEEEDVVLAERTFTTNSRQALLLAEAAKPLGRETFCRLHQRLFEAYLLDNENIGDEAVLRRLATECALPEGLPDRAWSDPAAADRLRINLRHARELGLTGVPAYVFGQEKILGAVPEERLRAAAGRLLTA